MEDHVRNVGRLLFYMGIAMGLIGLIVLISHGGYGGLLLTNNPLYRRTDLGSIPLPRVLAAVEVTFSLLMALPVTLAGWALLQWKPWAKTYALLVASLNMLLFPVGTLAGVYILWVLNDESTDYLFRHAEARRRR